MAQAVSTISSSKIKAFWKARYEVTAIRNIISSTHRDLQGDSISRSGLESYADCINDSGLWLNVDHDPTLPPVGRVSNATVVRNTDDHYVLYADIAPLPADAYLLLTERSSSAAVGRDETEDVPVAPPRYVFTYNPHVVPEDIVRDITSVSDRVDSQPQVQKSLTADLLLGGIIIVGGWSIKTMAKGFLDQVGRNLADVASRKASQTLQRRRRHRNATKGRGLISITIPTQEWTVHGHVMGRTTKSFHQGFNALDSLAHDAEEFAMRYETEMWSEAHFQFNHNTNSWEFLYAVRRDDKIELNDRFSNLTQRRE